MVRINYYEDPSKEITSDVESETVGTWLIKNFNSRDELLDLRFFKSDLLGEEINTEDTSFIDIREGVVCVIKGSSVCEAPAIPYIVAFIISAVVSAVIAGSIDVDTEATSTSSTNALGDNNNEPKVNGRIDDILGTVNKHMPPLWQQPYRIGVNNTETEVLFVCVGRGRYAVNTDNIYDGSTRYKNIPNAKIGVYEPGTYPGNGPPSQTIGNPINEPIGIYRQSNDLNSSELVPPNDLAIGADALWKASTSATTMTLTLINSTELGISLEDYFTVGQDLSLIDCYVGINDGTNTLWRASASPLSEDFDAIDIRNISGEFEVSNVTSTTVTVTGPLFFTITDEPLLTEYYEVYDENNVLLFTTLNSFITSYSWFEDEDLLLPVTDVLGEYNPDVGQVFNNVIGPISIEPGAERVIVNLTSLSGFYKLNKGTKKRVTANIQFTIEETDVDDIPTGNSFTVDVEYTSNDGNLSYSVYKTVYIDIPYANSRIYARRTTDRDLSDNVSNVDNCEWTLLYSFESIDPNHDFGDVTLMQCVIPSNSQSRLVKERKTNLDVTRKITQYFSGGTFGPVESCATDQFDQIMIHASLDQRIGRLTIDEIDAEGFLDLRDEMISYYGDDSMCVFGYDFDSSDYTFQDTFATIAEVVNCKAYTSNGIYSAFFEKLQTESTMQVTHRNKITGSEIRSTKFRQKYDGVELNYRDNETGDDSTIYIPSDGSAVKPETVSLPGCTSELQATRYAKRIRNKQIHGIHSVSFDMDEFGRMIIPGSRIDSPDSTRFTKREDVDDGYRIYDGEIVEVDGLNVELSQPVSFTEGEDHYIQFTTIDGGLSENILCTETDDEFIVTMQSIPVEPLYDGYERDRTKFIFMSEQLKDALPLIPQTVEFSLDDEGNETNTITSTNYSDRYYDGDQETI